MLTTTNQTCFLVAIGRNITVKMSEEDNVCTAYDSYFSRLRDFLQ